MKRAWFLLPLGGCYLGGHGSVDTAVHRSTRGDAAPQAALDLGLGAGDETRAGALLLSVGATPLVDRSAPRATLLALGGRYERALSARRPWLRGFTRVLLGGNLCPEQATPREEPDPACDTPEERRAVSMVSLALGVTLTATGERRGDELTPAYGTLGVGVVYTHAADEVLGSADFLGVELSGGFGVDLYTAMTRDDD